MICILDKRVTSPGTFFGSCIQTLTKVVIIRLTKNAHLFFLSLKSFGIISTEWTRRKNVILFPVRELYEHSSPPLIPKHVIKNQ